jgi:snurportin-1
MKKKRYHPLQLEVRYQKKRREKYLQEQESRRSDLLDVLRGVTSVVDESRHTHGTDDGRDEKFQGQDDAGQSAKVSARAFWASQLMIPEWMVDVPSDIGTNWYVMARPEGQRCLVVISHGTVSVRNRAGATIDTFPSSHVHWTGDHQVPHKEYILDCIYQSLVFHVTDVLCWGGHELLDCTAEFRMYWKASHVTAAISGNEKEGKYSFRLLEHYEANPVGIQKAYCTDDSKGFCPDGMIFLHKQCCYHGGQTPLMLTWKDPHTSKYFIDTDSMGVISPLQSINLIYGGDLLLQTGDDEPVTVARLPASFVQSHSESLKPGSLLRFSLLPHGISILDDGAIWLSLQFLGTANRRRKKADHISKILFQHMARNEPLTIDTIIAVSKDSVSTVYDETMHCSLAS